MSDCPEAPNAGRSGNETAIKKQSEEDLRVNCTSMRIVAATMLALAVVSGVDVSGVRTKAVHYVRVARFAAGT
jgi:hypothetical protein